MKRNFGTFILLVVILMATMGCEKTTSVLIPPTPSDDEESTVQLSLTDTYDNVRNGAHLIMSYDAASNSFKGTVTNVTDAILTQVRVEIHLSNGVELGPTPPVDLLSGETISIELQAAGPSFDKWTAHPEVGPSTGSGGEGSGEHGQGSIGGGETGGGERSGEHGQGGEGPEVGGN